MQCLSSYFPPRYNFVFGLCLSLRISLMYIAALQEADPSSTTSRLLNFAKSYLSCKNFAQSSNRGYRLISIVSLKADKATLYQKLNMYANFQRDLETLLVLRTRRTSKERRGLKFTRTFWWHHSDTWRFKTFSSFVLLKFILVLHRWCYLHILFIVPSVSFLFFNHRILNE